MSKSATNCKTKKTISLPEYSGINQNMVNQLDDLLSVIELNKAKHSLIKLFFEYIHLNADYVETLPEDFGETSRDLYALYNFLTNLAGEFEEEGRS